MERILPGSHAGCVTVWPCCCVLTVVCVPFFRKAQESQKEMKLLLDMYRSAPKEQRDKVQLMAAEKKAKAEVFLISLLFFFFMCYLNLFSDTLLQNCVLN